MIDFASEEASITIVNLTIFLYIMVIIYFFFRLSHGKH
ncbi:putative membrane protein (plasmid) [Bacillus cereus 03BB108]|uniref:Membrane protein n=1 Tax=Bacillus cereus 03BB108 TaxID=451709 RepID=A0AAN0SRD1_BACCE|nr:putative membrane protein [Bacillus cereus 03BB108]